MHLHFQPPVYSKDRGRFFHVGSPTGKVEDSRYCPAVGGIKCSQLVCYGFTPDALVLKPNSFCNDRVNLRISCKME